MICPHCHNEVVAKSGPGYVLICSSCGRSIAKRTSSKSLAVAARARKSSAVHEGKPSGSNIGHMVSEQPRLGPYLIVGELGRGGMGRVFKAVHQTLRQTRAIKILTKSMSSDPMVVARFRREARIIAEVNHENIVRIFDFEQDPDRGHYYFIMEYVDGGSVSGILKRKGKLPWQQAAEITLQVARGLAAMNQRRLVHRDIKPSNILIDRAGTAKLADLGLARHEGDGGDTQLTAAGAVMGTVDYIPPEQVIDSRRADIRSDMYSLGCTLFHMLGGQVPFTEGSAYQKMQRHIDESLPEIGPLAPDVPFQLVLILNRLTEKNPENRYQTPQELIGDLEALLNPQGTETVEWQGSVIEQLAAIVSATSKEPAPSPTLSCPSPEQISEEDSSQHGVPEDLAAFLQALASPGGNDTASLHAHETVEVQDSVDPQLQAFLDALARDQRSCSPCPELKPRERRSWFARIAALPTWAIVGIGFVVGLFALLLFWALNSPGSH